MALVHETLNLIVVGPDGEIVLRGVGMNVEQIQYCDGQPIDFKIILERIDEQRMKTSDGIFISGEQSSPQRLVIPDYHHAPAIFRDRQDSPTERAVSAAISGLIRRKSVAEAAYQQEKIRSFAELYGGGEAVLSRLFTRRYEGFPALHGWKSDFDRRFIVKRVDRGYNGTDLEIMPSGMNRSTHYFDLGEQW